MPMTRQQILDRVILLEIVGDPILDERFRAYWEDSTGLTYEELRREPVVCRTCGVEIDALRAVRCTDVQPYRRTGREPDLMPLEALPKGSDPQNCLLVPLLFCSEECAR